MSDWGFWLRWIHASKPELGAGAGAAIVGCWLMIVGGSATMVASIMPRTALLQPVSDAIGSARRLKFGLREQIFIARSLQLAQLSARFCRRRRRETRRPSDHDTIHRFTAPSNSSGEKATHGESQQERQAETKKIGSRHLFFLENL